MGAQPVGQLYSCFHSDGSCPCGKLGTLETLVHFWVGPLFTSWAFLSSYFGQTINVFTVGLVTFFFCVLLLWIKNVFDNIF